MQRTERRSDVAEDELAGDFCNLHLKGPAPVLLLSLREDKLNGVQITLDMLTSTGQFADLEQQLT